MSAGTQEREKRVVKLTHGAIIPVFEKIKKDIDIGLFDYPVLHEEEDYLVVSNDTFSLLDYWYKFPRPIIVPTKNKQQLSEKKELRSPREWQENALKLFKMKKFKKGIIKMETGAGKTVFSYFLINRYIQHPTIVVVDKHVLLQQWKDSAIETLFGIKVAELNRKTLHEVFEEQNDVVITTVQFLLSLLKEDFRKYLKLFLNSPYNAVIYDEAHTTAASEMYAKSLGFFLHFDYIFGLTATPKRTKFEDFLGEVIVDPKKVGFVNEYKSDFSVKVLTTNFNIKFRQWRNMFWTNFLANYYTAVESNAEFLDFVANTVKELLNQNRDVLVVVNRLNTVPELEKRLPGIKVLTSQRKDEINENDRVVVATYNIASKGLDIPHLDTIVSLSLVRGNISFVQLVGRILRQAKNKKEPLAVFILDNSVKNHPDFAMIEDDLKLGIHKIL